MIRRQIFKKIFFYRGGISPFAVHQFFMLRSEAKPCIVNDECRTWRFSRIIAFFVFLAFSGITAGAQTLYPNYLRSELIENPLGIDIDKPSLSWGFKATGRNRKQSSYE